MFTSINNNCKHISNLSNIIDANKYLKYINFNDLKCFLCNNAENSLSLCIMCGEIYCSNVCIFNHIKETEHQIFINFDDISIFCYKCDSYIYNEILNLHIQYLYERKYYFPFYTFYSKEKIHEIKYNYFINNLKNNKFHNIIFCVGAGISTTAGIPDFRSKTGLFQQLQEKYNMHSPEEFFYLKTFFNNPIYFYEFCKYFDLSNTKPTITHKFMSFLTNKKNIIKYIFTQNIDNLELKAKIPENKLIFAHGSFNKGHCAQCKKEIDINLINLGIKNQKVVYCDECNGPCKPSIVFYSEALPEEFFLKAENSRDCDLCIVMGTSLQVYPFANIPKILKRSCWKIMINFTKIGNFFYDMLFSNSLMLMGDTTDNIIKKILFDCGWNEDFKNFCKEYYNDEDIYIEKKTELLNFNGFFSNNKEDLNKNNNNNNNLETINK